MIQTVVSNASAPEYGQATISFPIREEDYPENLKAKPKLWLWQLRDISIIGICMILSALALAQGIGMAPLVLTFLYAFLAIQVEDASILDFLRKAACFLFLQQQFYEWRLDR